VLGHDQALKTVIMGKRTPDGTSPSKLIPIRWSGFEALSVMGFIVHLKESTYTIEIIVGLTPRVARLSESGVEVSALAPHRIRLSGPCVCSMQEIIGTALSSIFFMTQFFVPHRRKVYRYTELIVLS
jgi:hypothetical protein